MQQCDECHKPLTEDDTYEYIVCGHCNTVKKPPPHFHCVKCGIFIRWIHIMNSIRKFLSNNKRIISYSSVAVFIAVICGIFWHNSVYQKILVGIGIVAAGLLAIVLAGYILFVCVYRLGVVVGNFLFYRNSNESMPTWESEYSDSALPIVSWLFGMAVLISPTIIYGLGLLLYILGSLFIK